MMVMIIISQQLQNRTKDTPVQNSL